MISLIPVTNGLKRVAYFTTFPHLLIQVTSSHSVHFSPQSPEQLSQIEQEAIRLSEEIKAEYWAVSAKSGGSQTHINTNKCSSPTDRPGFSFSVSSSFCVTKLLCFVSSLSQEMESRISSSVWHLWLLRPTFCPSLRKVARGMAVTSSVSHFAQ